VATRDWRNDETLYAKVIKSSPDFVGGYMGLPGIMRVKNNTPPLEYQLKSLACSDTDSRMRLPSKPGRLYGILGYTEESIRQYEEK
jgi:hypothetical protein